MNRWKSAIAVAIVGFALAACGGGPGTGGNEPPPPPPAAVPSGQQQAQPPKAEAPTCPSLCKAGENCWRHVGRSPFTGTLDDFLKLSDAPQWAKDQWKEQVIGGRATEKTMKDGTMYRLQVYSVGNKNIVWKNVRQSICRPLPGYVFVAVKDGERRVLFIPPRDSGGCDNWSELPPEKI